MNPPSFTHTSRRRSRAPSRFSIGSSGKLSNSTRRQQTKRRNRVPQIDNQRRCHFEIRNDINGLSSSKGPAMGALKRNSHRGKYLQSISASNPRAEGVEDRQADKSFRHSKLCNTEQSSTSAWPSPVFIMSTVLGY